MASNVAVPHEWQKDISPEEYKKAKEELEDRRNAAVVAIQSNIDNEIEKLREFGLFFVVTEQKVSEPYVPGEKNDSDITAESFLDTICGHIFETNRGLVTHKRFSQNKACKGAK